MGTGAQAPRPQRQRPADVAAPQAGSRRPSFRALSPAGQGLTDARAPEPGWSMWKLGRGRVLLDEPPDEDDGLAGGPPPAADAAAAQVQGASFRGWKEVASLFSNDDEQHLLGRCRSPKSRGTSLRLKEELKTEKKPGFWDSLVLKQNLQPKKPDEIEGWEPPRLALEDVAAESGDGPGGRVSRPGWEEGAKGSGKYTSLAGPGSGSRWSLKSAGKLVGIRRQSRGHLTDTWEELE